MRCNEIEVLLTESPDNAHLGEIRGHLSECQKCSRLLEEMHGLQALNFSLARLSNAPVDFSQRVERRLRQRRFRRRMWTIAASVAIFSTSLTGLYIAKTTVQKESVGGQIAADPAPVRQTPGVISPLLLADPAASVDLEEQYLEVILGESLKGSSSTVGVPSEIKVHRTDMGKVNLTHVSH